MEKNFNTFWALAQFFGTEGRRVHLAEFMRFWRSLSFEEQKYYRRVPLH